MAPADIERIEKMVGEIRDIVNTQAQVVFHLDAENKRHNKEIGELFDRHNATDKELAGFKGKVSAYGTVGGIIGGAVAAFFSRMIGSN